LETIIALNESRNNLSLETAEKIVGTKEMVVKMQTELNAHNWEVVTQTSDEIFMLNG